MGDKLPASPGVIGRQEVYWSAITSAIDYLGHRAVVRECPALAYSDVASLGFAPLSSTSRFARTKADR